MPDDPQSTDDQIRAVSHSGIWLGFVIGCTVAVWLIDLLARLNFPAGAHLCPN